ncbi:MAG: hypothetical protein AB7P99_19910 [Vicinamibacterales bacterium]
MSLIKRRRSVSQGAKLYLAATAGLMLASAGCGSAVRPVYDADSRLASRLDTDADRDGVVESRTYMVAGRLARHELDVTGDGRVDRWEYYRPDGTLARLGTSSAFDGIEDTWVVQTGATTEVEISTRRDGVIDRRETQVDGVLRRSEQDINFDGQPDQWATYEDGRVRELRIDSGLVAGRPDRRLLYGPDGALRGIEEDPDGDGTFAPLDAPTRQ